MLELGGESVALQPVKVLDTQQRTESRWFCGNQGSTFFDGRNM
jgi:hypothetical protein